MMKRERGENSQKKIKIDHLDSTRRGLVCGMTSGLTGLYLVNCWFFSCFGYTPSAICRPYDWPAHRSSSSSSHPATNRALSLFFWHDIKKGFADVFSSPSNQIVSGFVGIFLFSLSLLCYIKITTTCEWNHISIFICTLLLCNEWYVGKC